LKTKDFLTRKIKISGFSYSLNGPAHREPPECALSVSPEPQRGGDAVERNDTHPGLLRHEVRGMVAVL
jgi:hypothetical protein